MYSGFMTRDSRNRPPAVPSADEFRHRGNSLEWWYFSGHLADSGSFRRYGVEFVVFSGKHWLWGNGLCLNYAVSDELNGNFYSMIDFQRLRKRMIRDSVLRFSGKNNGLLWSLTGMKGNYRLSVGAGSEVPGLEMEVKAETPPVLQTANGYIPIDRKHMAGYFSYPYMKAEGRFSSADFAGKISGSVWMDKQWNCLPSVRPDTRWNWMCLQFDSSRDALMLFQVIDVKTAEQKIFGTYIHSDGRVQYLNDTNFVMTGSEWWYSQETGRAYPMVWQVTLPAAGLEFTVKPSFEDHEISLELFGKNYMDYWEGKCDAWGLKEGKPFTAKAFLEMTNAPVQSPITTSE